MSDYSSVTAGSTTFQWLLVDEDSRRIGLLLRTDPQQGPEAIQDMTALTDMLTEAGLEPEFEDQHVRLDRNEPPSVTVTWTGTVNDLDKTRRVLSRMADHWRIG